MSIYERIFHAILFELIAIILTIYGLTLFTQHDTRLLTGIVILISVIAMIWNIVFNWVFDHFFTENRERRGFKIRLFHTLLFEGGLLCFTLPLVASILKISLWQAFILDFSMTLFIMIYALIFNWFYDYFRVFFIKNRRSKLNQ